jgi:hypothetical protein
MRRALLGALLAVAGIAALIVASRHHAVFGHPGGYSIVGEPPVRLSGWTTTTYDVVRIGGWALIVFGAVILLFAVIRELRPVPGIGDR